MALNSVVDVRRSDLSQLDYTFDLISGLTDDELEAIQAIAIAFLKNGRPIQKSNDNDDITPFQPQTEEQLLARIDRSLAQIEAGMYSDAEDVENELLAEIGA